MSNIKLLIVTVAYKNADDLPAFVKSFNANNDMANDAKLVVVDNSPGDCREVEAVVKKYEEVAYLSRPDNPGFGAANNYGFEYCDSDYVLFINNDVEFLEPVFMKLISIFENESRLGCVGIKQLGGSPSFFKKINAPVSVNDDKFIDEYHFISGAFMFFKSNVFREIGMFDTNIFMYSEEHDISWRLLRLGYSTKFFPDLCFLHKVGDRLRLSEFTWITAIDSRFYLCDKYNFDKKIGLKGIRSRINRLFVFFLIRFEFTEVLKLIRVSKYLNRHRGQVSSNLKS